MTLLSSSSTRWLGVCVSLLAVACTVPEQNERPVPAERPRLTPTLPNIAALDQDGDHIEDRILPGLQRDDPLLTVEIVLNRPVDPTDLDAFSSAGGTPGFVFRLVSYGFLGKIPRSRIAELPHALGNALHLVALPPDIAPTSDLETRVIRARQAWPTTRGGTIPVTSANNTIAIFDTGIDDTHPDLAGRGVFWKDYTSDAHPSAADLNSHGTHVAGIALGSGAAFASGPSGTLRYTDFGSLEGAAPGTFGGRLVYFPFAVTATARAKFQGGYQAKLQLFTVAPGTPFWTLLGESVGNSPMAALPSISIAAEGKFIAKLERTVGPAGGPIGRYAIAHKITGYPASADAYPVMSGVAPGTRWYAGKIFRDDLTPDGTCLAVALEEMLQQRETLRVKVANLSISSSSPIIAAKAATVADYGVVVVASAGNGGPQGEIAALGLQNSLITVAASTAFNQVSVYSSIGPAAPTGGQVLKPDITASGGSAGAPVLSADTNDGDGFGYADAEANDYLPLQGTSMAAPMVSGAAALVIDAMEQAGHVWDFNSAGSTLQVKNVLLATATETNTGREGNGANAPSLGRAATPKDRAEGYGMLNVDAAVEAVTLAFVSPLSGSVAPSTMPQWEKRAWARRVTLRQNGSVQLTLDVPASGDFDLYLYASVPDLNGEPVILASSTNPAIGTAETIAFTSPMPQSAIVVVKRVSGTGTFNLAGTVNLPPTTPGVQLLTSAALTSDAGTPSSSEWGEYVRFSYVALGVTGLVEPTGTVTFNTTGMLVPGGPATGGTFGSASLVPGGTGCTGQTLPCSSAEYTTANLVPTGASATLNHRITASYAGDGLYAPEPTTYLNGVTTKNHTVKPRVTSHMTYAQSPPNNWFLYNTVLTKISTVNLGCPAGRTCITPPPSPTVGLIQYDSVSATSQAICDNPRSGNLRFLDANWSTTCRHEISSNTTSFTLSEMQFTGDGVYFATGTLYPGLSVGSFTYVLLSNISANQPTSAFGDPVSIRMFVTGPSGPGKPQISANFDLVDGPCNAQPPSPVLASYTNQGTSNFTFTTTTLPSGTHEIHACHTAGLTPIYRDIGVVIASVNPFLVHTVSGSNTAAATSLAINAAPATGIYGVDANFTVTLTSPSGPVSSGAASLSVDNLWKPSTALSPAGTATFVAPLLAVGPHPVRAAYVPTVGFIGSTGALAPDYVVVKAEPTIALEVEPSGVVAKGRDVLLRARLGRAVGANPAAELPTGLVRFEDNGNLLCESGLAPLETTAAVAECTYPSPASGTHPITVTYLPSADPRYVAPAPFGASFDVQVLQATLSFTLAPAASVFGESKTWTVQLAESTGNTAVVPGGTVTFARCNNVV
jgi:subtilisin family serine protease